ncbi:MAG: MFS transporter [Chromatiales bacterium]|nr:MFS transporter [Chromatiales bacterium]
MSGKPAVDTGGRLGALREPLYRRFWLGSLASVGATQLLFVGQGWLVYRLSGSAFDLGLLGAAASLPTIVVNLLGGALADRLDKRRVLVVTTAMVATLLMVLAVLDGSGIVRVWHVLLVSGLIALVSGVDWPTRQAIFPSLISRQHMLSAIALNAILWQGTRMIMPAAGGALIAVGGTSTLFGLASCGFLVMLLVLRTMPPVPPRPGAGSSVEQVIEGVRYIAGNRLFRVLIPLTYVSMFFGTSFLQLMPAFAKILGVGEQGFGALVSSSGVGSVAGTLVVGLIRPGHHLGRVMLSGLVFSTGGLFAFALVTGLAPSAPWALGAALFFVFFANFAAALFLITSTTVLQLHVPDSLRGRVMGIHAITYSLIALGGLFAGAVASVLGAPAAVVIGAGVVLVSTLVVAATQPEVRELAEGTGPTD